MVFFELLLLTQLFILLQAKVNNSSLIGVGYTQTLRPGKCYINESYCHSNAFLCVVHGTAVEISSITHICQLKLIASLSPLQNGYL